MNLNCFPLLSVLNFPPLSVSLHRVLEIRKGQLTEKFDRFPYDEVEDQSFSLIFEEVTKRYVRLTSLDLICDSHENCQEWIFGVS